MSFFLHRLIAEDNANAPSVNVLDRGLQLGDGVFDTMVAFGGRAFAFDRHIERLTRHATEIGIAANSALIQETIGDVIAEIGGRHAIIRTTLTRGQAARGLWPTSGIKPSLLVTAQPWTPSLLGQPARLAMASVPRNQCSLLSRIKSLAYLDNILAAREAAEAGVDDALILNLDGNAVCTTIANVFAIIDGQLVTPPLADGCLDGVMRALVLDEAGAMDLPNREASLTTALLGRAEALFLTNSVRVIRPVTALAGRALPGSLLTAAILARLLARIEHETDMRLELAPAPVQ